MMDEPENVIETYIERSQALLEASPQMGEENTKAKLIHAAVNISKHCLKDIIKSRV